ncbi:MAG: hypothetical protein U1F36_05580 [Planctomycetota bacterium]
MLNEVLAILGLGLGCAAWVIVQLWIGRRDPAQPGVERSCDGHGGCGGGGHCEGKGRAGGGGSCSRH